MLRPTQSDQMNRALLIKFTSLGDLIHALPALTDAHRAYPNLRFDWMIDENFAEIATWHPIIDQVFTTSHRTWRKNLFSAIKPIVQLIRSVKCNPYDLVIDGQGNFKTAFMSLFLKAPTAGFDHQSIREPIAAFAYQKTYAISWNLHAIDRLRQLFAMSLNYPCPTTPPDFAIDRSRFTPLPFSLPQNYFVFIHNASWQTKLWPEVHWKKLIHWSTQKGHTVFLPWGNAEEKQRAERLALNEKAVVLPKLSLSQIGTLLSTAKACVSMDTGLSHLAAALHIPSIILYGSTDSGLIGTSGNNQFHLQSPLPCAPCKQKRCRFTNTSPPSCLAQISPEQVFETLFYIIG